MHSQLIRRCTIDRFCHSILYCSSSSVLDQVSKKWNLLITVSLKFVFACHWRLFMFLRMAVLLTRMSQTCFLRLFFLILDAEFKLKLITFEDKDISQCFGLNSDCLYFAVCREDLGEILSSPKNVPFIFSTEVRASQIFKRQSTNRTCKYILLAPSSVGF